MHSHALHQVYASYMRNHPYGTAVYRPLPYREFHPGSVGYFDTNGDWNHITDLSSPESLQADQYSPPREALQLATPDNRIEWGPKASRNIHARHTALKAGVSPAVATVLPTDVSAHFTYSNATAGGALLLTTPPITRQRYYYETPFKRWVHDNAETLLRRREEITTYGLWIVCSTYATRDCAIHLWDERSREVDVGFDLGLDGVGELGPAGGWKLGSAQGGWERYSSDETDAGRVVFFGGLFFRPRRVPVGEVCFVSPFFSLCPIICHWMQKLTDLVLETYATDYEICRTNLHANASISISTA